MSRQRAEARPGTVGHPEFVGWWETVQHVVDGVHVPVNDTLELILPDGSFRVFDGNRLIGGGRHVDFIDDPPGFTNVQETTNSFATAGPQLVIYRLRSDTLGYCKAPEHDPRIPPLS
jgi:hypothetical protein